MRVRTGIIFATFLIMIFPNVYAQQSTDPCGLTTFDCYQETGFRLVNDPVICMDLPSDRNVIGLLRAYTQDAVMNWQKKIDGVGMSWNIQLLPEATSSACNITIHYLSHPSSSENLSADVAGITTQYTDNTASIEVFYDDIAVDDQGSYQFLDSLGPDYQIHWTIEHELGHAFGLGHYIASDNSTINSIMIPRLPSPYTVADEAGVITPQPVITTGDAVQLKSLYPNGFSQIPQQFSPDVPSIPTTNMTASGISYWEPLIKSYFGNSTNSLGSQDYLVNVLNLVDVLDSEHLLSVSDPVGNQTGVEFRAYSPSWIVNDLSWWGTSQISDKDLASTLQYLNNNGLFYFSR